MIMKIRFLAFLFVFITLPLQAQDDLNTPHMATPTCEVYLEWTGKHIDDIDLSILGDREHRILKPDSIITMDYIADRLNIYTTKDDIIIEQQCG